MKDIYYETFIEHAEQMLSGLRSGTKARREETIIYYCSAYYYKQGSVGNEHYEYIHTKFYEFYEWIKTNDPKNFIFVIDKLSELIRR